MDKLLSSSETSVGEFGGSKTAERVGREEAWPDIPRSRPDRTFFLVSGPQNPLVAVEICQFPDFCGLKICEVFGRVATTTASWDFVYLLLRGPGPFSPCQSSTIGN